MNVNLTIANVLFLSIITINNIHSQNEKIIKVGDVIYNRNIKIENDSIKSYYFFTEEGTCYGVKSKYKNSDLRNLEKIKSSFSNNWTKNEIGYNKDDDGYIIFDKYLCEITNGNYFYKLGYDYLDFDEKGIVLIGKYIDIENSGMHPSTTEKSFQSIDEFLADSEVIKTRSELEISEKERIKIKKLEQEKKIDQEIEKKAQQKIYDTTPIDEIILPYKLTFNLSEIELTNKLKLVFNDRIIKIKKHQLTSFQSYFKISLISFNIISKSGKEELMIDAILLKNKVYSYKYTHYNQESIHQLLEKNQELTLKYNKIYGHDSLVKRTEELEKIVNSENYLSYRYSLDSEFSFDEIAISEIKELIINEEVKYNILQEKIKESKSIRNKM